MNRPDHHHHSRASRRRCWPAEKRIAPTNNRWNRWNGEKTFGTQLGLRDRSAPCRLAYVVTKDIALLPLLSPQACVCHRLKVDVRRLEAACFLLERSTPLLESQSIAAKNNDALLMIDVCDSCERANLRTICQRKTVKSTPCRKVIVSRRGFSFVLDVAHVMLVRTSPATPRLPLVPTIGASAGRAPLSR